MKIITQKTVTHIKCVLTFDWLMAKPYDASTSDKTGNGQVFLETKSMDVGDLANALCLRGASVDKACREGSDWYFKVESPHFHQSACTIGIVSSEALNILDIDRGYCGRLNNTQCIELLNL